MDAPSYVQGLYTVAQRDAIFTKANKYPDAANGLQNQVPTIFPDGSIGWRQIPEGGDGTANANIAVVESTQYASKAYSVGDLLIYNGQLSRVSTPIAAGGTITPGTNVVSTTVALWAPESFVPLVGKGVNLLDNAYFIGGGTAGVLPINQRGQTGASAYPNYGGTIDRWSSNGGTVGVLSDGIALSGFIGGAQLYQKVENYAAYKGKELTVSALGSSSDGASYYITVYDGTSYTDAILLPASNGLVSKTFTVSQNATLLHVIIVNYTSGATASLEAVKLELGTQQTLARQVNGSWVLNDLPPNYQQELAKCQRYLNVFKLAPYQMLGTGVAISATEARISISLPAEMAASPTVTLTGILDLYNGSSAIQVTSVSTYTLCGNNLMLAASVASGLSTGAAYMFIGDSNSSVASLTIEA